MSDPKTRPYRPSNGCEGMDFIEHFCGRCKQEVMCEIPSATQAFMADDPRYPREWVQDVPFGNARCTAFEEANVRGGQVTDYTAEVEARLHAQGYECHCTSPDDCCQDCADIRAALGEIERLQGRVAGEHFESVAWQNRAECLAAIGQARTQDEDTPEEIAEERITSLVAENDQLKAKLAEWERLIGAEMPSDYKDWHQNSKAEWPDVAAASLRSRKADADLAWDTVAKLGAEVERLSKMCCVCEGDCCRLAKERKVEIEQWREALSFAEGCIPAQIMLALRLSGMPESRATVGEIAAWLRAALRGGGERCLCDDDSPNHCAKCTRELLRGGGK